MMKNLLMSAAVGDYAGSAYEGRSHRTKDYNAIKMFSSRAHFTDDTVLTFACAEAFLHDIGRLWASLQGMDERPLPPAIQQYRERFCHALFLCRMACLFRG